MSETERLKNKLKDKTKNLLNTISEYRKQYYTMMSPSEIEDVYNNIMHLEQLAAEYRRINRLDNYIKYGYEIVELKKLDEISKKMLDIYKNVINYIKIHYFKYLADDMINIHRKYFNSGCFEKISTDYIREIWNFNIFSELGIQTYIITHAGYNKVERLYCAINCISSLDCIDDYEAFYDVQNEKEYNHRINLLSNLEVNLKAIEEVNDIGLRNAIIDYLFSLFETSGKLYLSDFLFSENK